MKKNYKINVYISNMFNNFYIFYFKYIFIKFILLIKFNNKITHKLSKLIECKTLMNLLSIKLNNIIFKN